MERRCWCERPACLRVCKDGWVSTRSVMLGLRPAPKRARTSAWACLSDFERLLLPEMGRGEGGWESGVGWSVWAWAWVRAWEENGLAWTGRSRRAGMG